MDCWHCNQSAVGICRFCGRGICATHTTTRPYILQLYRNNDTMRALVVDDALHCGTCTPRPDPIDLPDLT